ncbi:hypothetical protein BN7_2327 [Wickerhamomyces ciferrii]|uniref:Uncharacterized protein n=1 Tax=Wickerhamomyces ciferrii (strain ATCC 14091 / BCRC 22168 / CBS 111 / JCM 3599 / NBRC 0793 / NRRL Y-1031 F-60-10) TaxID=1206466 RepID=K0KNW3_WICCF|nr:uncharacterized protein BN7_2327 [Wickerhamomyces ciferrii]CCH42783.1 hypothetical protein BN7_2327 [Wickerhamomyces ciferrii]
MTYNDTPTTRHRSNAIIRTCIDVKRLTMSLNRDKEHQYNDPVVFTNELQTRYNNYSRYRYIKIDELSSNPEILINPNDSPKSNVIYERKESFYNSKLFYKDSQINTYKICQYCDPFEEMCDTHKNQKASIMRNGEKISYNINLPFFYDSLHHEYQKHLAIHHGILPNNSHIVTPFIGINQSGINQEGVDVSKSVMICPHRDDNQHDGPCLAQFKFDSTVRNPYEKYLEHVYYYHYKEPGTDVDFPIEALNYEKYDSDQIFYPYHLEKFIESLYFMNKECGKHHDGGLKLPTDDRLLFQILYQVHGGYGVDDMDEYRIETIVLYNEPPNSEQRKLTRKINSMRYLFDSSSIKNLFTQGKYSERLRRNPEDFIDIDSIISKNLPSFSPDGYPLQSIIQQKMNQEDSENGDVQDINHSDSSSEGEDFNQKNNSADVDSLYHVPHWPKNESTKEELEQGELQHEQTNNEPSSSEEEDSDSSVSDPEESAGLRRKNAIRRPDPSIRPSSLQRRGAIYRSRQRSDEDLDCATITPGLFANDQDNLSYQEHDDDVDNGFSDSNLTLTPTGYNSEIDQHTNDDDVVEEPLIQRSDSIDDELDDVPCELVGEDDIEEANIADHRRKQRGYITDILGYLVEATGPDDSVDDYTPVEAVSIEEEEKRQHLYETDIMDFFESLNDPSSHDISQDVADSIKNDQKNDELERAKLESVPIVESKPESKSESESESKPDFKAESKPEPKPESKSESPIIKEKSKQQIVPLPQSFSVERRLPERDQELNVLLRNGSNISDRLRRNINQRAAKFGPGGAGNRFMSS